MALSARLASRFCLGTAAFLLPMGEPPGAIPDPTTISWRPIPRPVRPRPAGFWHSPANLICLDCHTVHYSEENADPPRSEPGGPWKRLLLRQTTNGLCLSCHDGTETNCPDVLGPAISTSYAPDEHSGGGYLQNLGGDNPNGHNLGYSADGGISPPLAGGVAWTVPAGGITCADCHNPHGSANYRNLKLDPNNNAVNTAIAASNPAVATDDVFVSVYPNGTNPGAAYRRGNVGYRRQYAAWCTECHGLLATNAAGTSPAHFQRHPSNVALNAAGYHTDSANWILGSPNGVGTTTGDGAFGVPRVRFQAPAATTFALATTVAATNEVFCGSCHLAHGWMNLKGLAWPYRETPAQADTYAGCEQCHNK